MHMIRKRHLLLSSLTLIYCAQIAVLAADAPTFDRHVVVVVWDGMRPDLISPALTPILARLADDGVRFRDSHAVFPTVTRINSASA